MLAKLLAAAAMSAVAVAALHALPQQRTLAQRVLDRYARDAVVPLTENEVLALVTELPNVGTSWISEDPANAPRRRQIAALVALELAAQLDERLLANTPKVEDWRLAAYRWGGLGLSFRPQERITVRETMKELQLLSGDPLVGAEATLHLGILEFLLGQIDASLTHLQAALQHTTDPHLLNLDWLMQGLVYESRGDSAAALAGYRSALEALPTTSAATALSVALFRSGQRGEAAATMERAYKSPSGWWERRRGVIDTAIDRPVPHIDDIRHGRCGRVRSQDTCHWSHGRRFRPVGQRGRANARHVQYRPASTRRVYRHRYE